MGFFSKIKELFSARRYITRVMEEMDRQNARYAAMRAEELAALSDDDLCSAVLYRIDQAIAAELGNPAKADPVEAAEILCEEQRTVYVLACWESELAGGGIGRFLSGDCGGLLPLIAPMLERVNASEHRSLLLEFAKEYGIDLSGETSYATANEFDYAALTEKIRFSDFDVPYRMLPDSEALIVAYVRERIERY